MYRQGRYLAIRGMVGHPWDPQTIPLLGSPSRKFDPAENRTPDLNEVM